MTLPLLSAAQVQELLREGACLIYIREADEFAREHIPSAYNHPLSALAAKGAPETGSAEVIFSCKSGIWTVNNATQLAAVVNVQAYSLEGGLDGWKRSGFKTKINRKAPVSIQRQVQIIAGALIVLGAKLGFFVQPTFYALSAAIGAGLLFSGLSGSRAMAQKLKFLAWNRQSA